MHVHTNTPRGSAWTPQDSDRAGSKILTSLELTHVHFPSATHTSQGARECQLSNLVGFTLPTVCEHLNPLSQKPCGLCPLQGLGTDTGQGSKTRGHESLDVGQKSRVGPANLLVEENKPERGSLLSSVTVVLSKWFL